MARKFSFISSICILIITLFLLFDFSNSAQPKVENGVLNLENWNFKKNGTVHLDGEWDFYSGQLIMPNDFKQTMEDTTKRTDTIQVPGIWNDKINKDKLYATYHLTILVPEDGQYGLKINKIRYASRVYINGKEAGHSGNPTTNLEQYENKDNKYTAFGESVDGKIDIIIHVGNKSVVTGGITQSIDFGTATQINALRDTKIIVEGMMISGYLLLSILYLAFFLQRRKNVYELYFGLFCFAQGIYMASVNEKVLFILFNNISSARQLDIQLLFIHLATLFFLLFIYHFFKPFANKKIVSILSTVILIQSVILGTPLPVDLLRIFPVLPTQLYIIVGLAFAFCYIVFLLIKVFLKKTEGSEYVLMAGSTFVCYGLALAINFIFDIDIGSIPVFLFVALAISISLLITNRSYQAYNRIEELSNELLQYDKIKDDFLIKTSHELNTPLHGILNLSKSLAEGSEGPLKKEQQESALLIYDIGKRLAKIVESLLDAGKIKRGEVLFNPCPVNIRVIESLIAELSYLIPDDKQIKIMNNTNQNLPFMYIDEDRFKQILFNLIYNAIKYTKSGEITVNAEIEDEFMKISITDTGVGIEKDQLDTIFSSFYQINCNGHFQTEGLGLGLSITKQLVEISGGRIWATSEVGKGSCFTFTVPLASESQISEHTSDYSGKNTQFQLSTHSTNLIQLDLPIKMEGSRKETILVVDDEHANLKVLINLLHSLDYTVIAVDRGDAALEVMKNEVIDMMILDLMMPEMSGFDVCKLVRQEYELIELPIIILTASGQLSDLILSFQLGANDFLQKPIHLEELKVRVESMLNIKNTSVEALNQELSYFYSQITPHFLYNTLNAIIGLSYRDEEQTREALLNLSTYFRAKLDFNSHESFIHIKSEIETVQAYIAIEKMRFGERLNVEYEIDETIEAYIPSLTLQPLVENAVQHGITKKANGGTLKLKVKRVNDYVEITVEDNGIGIPLEKQKEIMADSHSRIGFINPYKKLKLIKGSQFLLESVEGLGTKITIRLPERSENLIRTSIEI
nr:ATP-binding protein [Lysinibacillus timonensis]